MTQIATPPARSSGSGPWTSRAGLSLATALALLVCAACAACDAVSGAAGQTDKAGGTVSTAPVELRLINTRGEEAQPFLDRVSELSGGSLRLISGEEKFERGALTAETDALRALKAGQADVAVVPTRAFGLLGVHSFDALMAPMVIDHMALQQQVLADPVTDAMLSDATSAGFPGVGVLPGPIRLPDGVTRKLLGPSSYAGARIATSPSPVGERSLRALGALPVRSAFEGADMSSFDGLEQQAGSIAGNEYDGVVHWITANVGLWPRPVAVVASPAAWAKLSTEQRGWLVRAAKDAAPETSVVQTGEEELANMCRRHRVEIIEATDDEIAQLRRAVIPVDRWLRRRKVTGGFLDRILAIKAQAAPAEAGQPIDCATLAPGSDTGTPGATTAIDGDYTLSFTAQETSEAEGDPEAPPVSENWGDFRLVFDRGHFASTQHNSLACTWNYGTFTLEDDILTLSVVDGGGKAPNGAVNKPGEVFTYKVSSYRGSMKWSAVPGFVSPAGWAFKPWRRQVTKPWTDFLESRCPPPTRWTD